MKKELYVACGLATALLGSGDAAAQETVRFGGQAWAHAGGEARVERLDGREALRLRSALLTLADAEFGDGTIEFDFHTTGHRSFVGLGFRVDDAVQGYEYFYLRPHQTGRFDAMQYTPVHHGLSAWQLYPEYNATGWIRPEEWLHVRMEIEGSSLTVYLGDAEEPVLSVARLERAPAAGGLAVVASFPDQAELADVFPNAIANLRIMPSSVALAASAAVEASESGPPTLIRRWDVSTTFPAPAWTIAELPQDVIAGEWESIWTDDAKGRLDIGRHRARIRGEHGSTVLARTVLRSDRPQVKRLDFGFSDRGSVFLNGRLLFTADNTYLSRSERYLGVMTVDNDALYLPLREGDNELLVAVSEQFGGWGLIARLGDLDGISMEPATH